MSATDPLFIVYLVGLVAWVAMAITGEAFHLSYAGVLAHAVFWPLLVIKHIVWTWWS